MPPAPAPRPALQLALHACLRTLVGSWHARGLHTHYNPPRQNLLPAHLCPRNPPTLPAHFLCPPCPRAARRPVVITVGPACQTVEKLVALLEAGVTCARIDLTVRA